MILVGAKTKKILRQNRQKTRLDQSVKTHQRGSRKARLESPSFPRFTHFALQFSQKRRNNVQRILNWLYQLWMTWRACVRRRPNYSTMSFDAVDAVELSICAGALCCYDHTHIPAVCIAPLFWFSLASGRWTNPTVCAPIRMADICIVFHGRR